MNEFYERISKLSPKRLTLLAMELQARVEALERAKSEPIAVIGMACRFPGGANSPEAFWQLLQEGRDAITEVPRDRWDVNALFDADADAPGKMSSRWGGFIDGVAQFDPLVFGITPREAQTMDPQQRLMLEVCWEALERAGCAPDQLLGSATGVFAGVCNSDYYPLLMAGGSDNVDMYLATGNAHSVISGRVSYTLGLQGPSLSIDTACSSSLVAIHSAVQSLRAGECRLALAGGVNAILSPDVTITLSKAKMMAPDGHCKAFDSAADGFVRSEGCGVVVLKRLADAQADGDTIVAVIRGSAINQDGRSNGLTAPNGPSQVAVIRAALADAGLTPADIGYVECHGTGTSLGDPIEVQALGAALGSGHSAENPLMIGSVKTNVGHMEATAGVAGLIKLILALQNAEIPPHLHLREPSPHIPWADLPITVPTHRTPWVTANGRRIGGTSSFGFSGTNVHLIVEAAPPVESAPPAERPVYLLTLSAKTEAARAGLAERYARHLAAHPQLNFAEVAYTANTGRAALPHRLAVVAATAEQAQQKLLAFLSDPQSAEVIRSSAPVAHPREAAFLFTGHGAQYAHMGRQLYETMPLFRQAIDQCDELLRPHLPQPLLAALFPAPGAPDLLQGMTYTQPALFALQYALAEVWRAWGVRPAAVMGHSLGEYAAAVVAGIFSLEDGLKLVAARGRLMDGLPQAGSMAAIFAPEAQVAEALRPHTREVSIAAINGPTSIVISGVTSAVEAVQKHFEAQGVKSRRLAVGQAAHSPLMEPMLDEFERIAASIQFSAPRLELISCTTGQPVSPAEVMTAAYWRRHLRQAVQFVRAIDTLLARGYGALVEIGPQPTLLGMAQRFAPPNAGAWIPSLREGYSDWEQMLAAAGQLFARGVDVDWRAVDGPRRKVILPTYPFDHQRYWGASAKKAVAAGRALAAQASPLLGARLNSPAVQGAAFETQLSAQWPAYLDHHRIYGTAIAPSPAYIEMAVRAAEAVWGAGAYRVENLTIQEALVLPDDGERTVQFLLTPDSEGRGSFKVVSLGDDNQWKTHVTGAVARAEFAPRPSAPHVIAEAQKRCAEQMTGADYYAGVAQLGLEFGESFKGLQHVWRRDGEAVGRVALPESLTTEAKAYRFHPALLDACFHLLGAPLPGGAVDLAYLLIGLESFQPLRPPPAVLWNHTTLREHAGETFTGDVRLYDEAGNLVAEVLGLQLKRASREALRRIARPRVEDWLYSVEWPLAPRPLISAPARAPGRWLIVADAGGVGRALAEALRQRGNAPRLIAPSESDKLNELLAEEWAGVLYLGALDSATVDSDSPAREAEEHTWAVIALTQALLRAKHSAPPALWIATRAAQPVLADAEPLNTAAAPLWGLGRVIALEHPELWGGLIDLQANEDAAVSAQHLLAEMTETDGEDQLAFRNGQRHAARLVRAPRPAAPAYTWRADGAYLITGGLGGLGLRVARWMAQNGARHIVLIGRRAVLSAEQTAAIKDIEALGATVAVEAVDVADIDRLTTLLATFGAQRPALRGVVHTAAALSHAPVAALEREAVADMFRPKLAGTWNLHRLTRALPLDFFVLFSSSTALWGSSQLAHYAAANAFLDSFAHQRCAQGLPALSLNWGTWEVMRAASTAEQARVAQFGLEQMPAEAALHVLGDLLTTSTPQLTVAAVDWNALKPAYSARRRRPFLEQVESKRAAPHAAAPEKKASLRAALAAVPPEARREFIVAHVRERAAKVIGLADPTALDIQQGLFEIGLDSLMSVELKSLLEASVEQALPSTLTFNYPTIADLAKYLDTVVLAEVKPVAPEAASAPESAPAIESEMDDMTEDDLAALLAAKLSHLK